MSEVKVPFVDVKVQYLSIREEIDHAVRHTLEEGQFVAGDQVAKFEEQFAQYLGVRHCITCGNGTDALEMSLTAMEIGPGDEVIVPANSWVSTAEAVSHVGARPVFADVLPDQYTIDPKSVVKTITTKTRCIVPVHLTGLSANMPELMQLAEKHDLLVLEDCAQAHGASIHGQKVGTFGKAGTFSFYPSKNLGAFGDGGCIATNDDHLAERLRRLGNHGQLDKHDHAFIGRNSRLDSLQAAVLSVKLTNLDQWNQQRKQVAMWYDACLHRDIKRPVVPEGHQHAFHLYMIRVSERDQLRDKLAAAGVMTGIHYPVAIPLTEAYRYLGHQPDDFPITVALSQEIISLPMYPEITEAQVHYVAAVINEFISERE